jgi:hypothetical protein
LKLRSQERKNGLGGRRNPLKRLNSHKENKVNSLVLFGRSLANEVRIWPDLGKFGFGLG